MNSDPTRFHLRLFAASVLLIGLACVQDAGMLIADTKFDLVLNPGDFLSRALHLWDAEGAFGQLQNQAYGYLWPMGPFFLLGDLIQLPGWLVQRLWIGLVMVVAFVGAAKVIRALGVRSDVAAIVAALAYALSPRMLTTLGPISIEAWPSALAPWVLLPLVIGAERGSPRRAAALSALAVAMVGGVNAAATFAVLPMGVLWLLTRTPGVRRRTMMIWWPLFTALGTLWWLVPLFTLGAYSPPFLDYIESASVTTIPTNLFDAWRGTSDWVAYVTESWRGGRDLITNFFGPLNSAVLLTLGAVGLILRRNPHRQFLVLSLLTGLLMVTMGHLGAVQGWFAEELRVLLDGSLKPLRNVHKFDPIVRLPMVIGLAWVIESVWRPLRSRGTSSAEERTHRFNRTAFTVLTVVALVGSATPIFAGRLAPTNPVLDVPRYWYETADWLEERAGERNALLVPGSGFADYVWGAPRDEPLQAIADSRWAVRNAIPLTPPGNIRMLDEIEKRISRGAGSAGLVDYLGRVGVRYLVVRNDLRPSEDVPDPAVVHEALATSPGVTRVASFGPDVGGEPSLARDGTRTVINGGAQARWPAVEIYAVPSSAPAVVAETTPVVVGGPEDLLDLGELGVVGEAPAELAVDRGEAPEAGQPLVLTDGLQQRERFFGRVHDGYSPVWAPGDIRRSGNPVADYDIDPGDRWQTTARLTGAEAVSASSSASDSGAHGGAQPGRLPYAALDGDVTTQWASGILQSSRTWWRVDFERLRDVGSVVLTAPEDAPGRQRLRLVTDGQQGESFTLDPGETRRVPLGAERAGWLRVENASSLESNQIALAEVQVAGLDVVRRLDLPSLPAGWPSPAAVVLRTLDDARTGCVEVGNSVRCLRSWHRSGEEEAGAHRRFTVPEATGMQPRLTVRARAGEGLNALLKQGQVITATASSEGIPDPRASASAAIDGDPGTAWSARGSDLRPTLSLNWVGQRTLRGISLRVDAGAPVRQPQKITLVWPGGRRTVELDDGEATFRPIRTDQLAIRVLEAEDVVSLGFDSFTANLPVGISEVELDGLPLLPSVPSDEPRTFRCGSGPTVTVNGETRRTRVGASPRQLLSDEAIAAEFCSNDPIQLRRGANQVSMTNSEAFSADSLVLTAAGAETDPAAIPLAGPVELTAPSPVERRIQVPDSGAELTLTVRENANPGWSARQQGRSLTPVVLDGWQQGWRLQGSGEVTMRFTPDSTYRAGLAVGAAGFGLLVLLVLWSTRWRKDAGSPSAGPRHLSAPAFAGLGLLGVGFLGGLVGVALALVGGGLTLLVWRRSPSMAAWLVPPALIVAGAAWVLRPWGDSSGWAGNLGWPIYLTLLVLGAVLSAGVAEGRRLHPFRRMKGSSTHR